jgi:hypothetical protein
MSESKGKVFSPSGEVIAHLTSKKTDLPDIHLSYEQFEKLKQSTTRDSFLKILYGQTEDDKT